VLSITKRLALTSAAGALALAGIAGFMAPASAAQLPAAGTGLTAATLAAKPNVNIQGKPAAWKPTKLSVKPKPFTTCTTSKVVWTITNKTKKAQTISYKVGSGPKSPLGTLAAGQKAGICSKGTAGTKESFYLKGSKSVLHLTLS
jgi:hypothetical protein